MIIYVCVCYRDTPLTHSIYIILTFLASFLVKYIYIYFGWADLLGECLRFTASCMQTVKSIEEAWKISEYHLYHPGNMFFFCNMVLFGDFGRFSLKVWFGLV